MDGMPNAALVERARALLAEHPVVDGHNDLPWAMRRQVEYDLAKLDVGSDQTARLHTDLPRLRAGGVGAQYWSVYVRPSEFEGADAVKATREQIKFVYDLVARYPDVLRLALSADDVEAARAEGKIASLMGAEGGHSINCSLDTLREMYELGVRYMTLTHSLNVPWAASCTGEAVDYGLTRFGEEVVREMNRLGMLVDLSHVAPATMRDALRVSRAPVIFSHSSSLAMCDNPRNIPDDVLATLADNGGVAMATFVPEFVSGENAEWWDQAMNDAMDEGIRHAASPEGIAFFAEYEATRPRPRVTVATVADHLDHMREVAGAEHLGLGGDFDGTSFTPAGLDDVSGYPNLIAELLGRGWCEADLAALTWGNAVRVLREAESVAEELRRTEEPSTATLEQLDGAAH